jgi:hypothetical protein
MNDIRIEAIKARLGSLSPKSKELLPLSVKRLLDEDLKALIDFYERQRMLEDIIYLRRKSGTGDAIPS